MRIERLQQGLGPPVWIQATAFAAGAVLAGLSALAPLFNDAAPRPVVAAVAGSSSVAILIWTGIFEWRRMPSSRFGQLLILTGMVYFLASLSAAGNEWLYSIGRVSFWVFNVVFLYVFLTYPTGRLTSKIERTLVAVGVANFLLLYLPTALVVPSFATSPMYCTDHCPLNAFAVFGGHSAFVESIVVPLRDMIHSGLFIAATLVLLARIRRATPLMRTSLAPVFAGAVVRFLATAALFFAHRDSGQGGSEESLAWIVTFSVPVAALGILLGLLRWRLYSARVLEDLAVDLDGSADGMRDRLAATLGDRSLALAFPIRGRPGEWCDHTGAAVTPADPSERCVITIDDQGDPVATISCDPALSDQRALLEAVASSIRGALVRQRLTAELKASLRDVESSRHRLAAAAAEERRRIERDLHDSVQQDLIGLRVKLALAEDEVRSHPEQGARLLCELGPRIDSVIDDIRSLAQGIYPSLLADAGVGEALRAASRNSAYPVTVTAHNLSRYPLEVESAVYFCCLEALQNANKHAGASSVEMQIAQDEHGLSFEVRDDGVGFAPNNGSDGTGLTNMRDRIAAVGGWLHIDSAPGKGTTVRGVVPLPV